jgi:hypothetical protein
MASYLSSQGKRAWSAKENTLLRSAVRSFGIGQWKKISEFVPDRDPTQCSQHWKKVLDPKLVKGFWREEEDELLLHLKVTSVELTW